MESGREKPTSKKPKRKEKAELACKPGSVESNHLSRTPVTKRL